MAVEKNTKEAEELNKFEGTLETIKSTAPREEEPDRSSSVFKKAQAKEELNNISRVFGSVENYTKLYPDYKNKATELKKLAFNT